MKKSVISILTIGLLTVYVTVLAQNAPFGTDEDRAFGSQLWDVLEQRGLVGENAIMSMPYLGNDPHGNVLVALESNITVGRQTGEVIVKRNYGGSGATIETVSNDPENYLVATTVMFRRNGFDSANNDWFWAKWMADGSYDNAPNGNPLVGKAPGCINCHNRAPGGDMVYLNDKY